jgi:hypothetical protein
LGVAVLVAEGVVEEEGVPIELEVGEVREYVSFVMAIHLLFGI